MVKSRENLNSAKNFVPHFCTTSLFSIWRDFNNGCKLLHVVFLSKMSNRGKMCDLRCNNYVKYLGVYCIHYKIVWIHLNNKFGCKLQFYFYFRQKVFECLSSCLGSTWFVRTDTYLDFNSVYFVYFYVITRLNKKYVCIERYSRKKYIFDKIKIKWSIRSFTFLK